MDLSVAAARVLAEEGAFKGHRPLAVAGRASSGVDVRRRGVLPTPAVAYLTKQLHADVGVMWSASLNPAPDNGIKFFDSSGYKLPDELEDRIEARLGEPWDPPTGAGVGRVREAHGAVEQYVAHLLSTVPVSLDGLRVVVDCANGAACDVAPEALRRAGAEVF